MSVMESSEKHRGKWRDAARQMQERIESGRWRSGQKLPSVGELCAELVITHPTLHKAMERLAEAGLVEPLPRGWKVATRTQWTGGMSIAFLRRCHPDGSQVVEADREAFFRRSLELEASRRGLCVENWGITSEGELFRGRARWTGSFRETGIGGMVVSLWQMCEASRDLQVVQKIPLPLAIWDERANDQVRPRFPKVRWFNSGQSERGGAMVGRHLADLGHREVAWISPFHGSVWSSRRRKGLADAFAALTTKVRLWSYALDDRWDPDQFTPQSDSVKSLLGQIWDSTPETLRGEFDRVVESGRSFLRDREILACLEGMFEAALDNREITAWVCANDDIARLAWAWLEQRGRKVGTDISLVGYDNTLRSQEAGLTSVGFLEEDLAAAMVAYLLDPTRQGTNGSTSLDGTLVVRASSSRRRS
jgi:DNA-binding LacI/PurR family transcriptional regulator